MRRRSAVIVALCLSGALPLVVAAPAEAAPAPPTTGTPTVIEARDYQSEAFADPWDFSNPEDFNTSPMTPSEASGVVSGFGISGVNMSGGQLNFTTGPWASIAFGNSVAGALPIGRDTANRPMDLNTFTKVSFRMSSNVASSYALGWYSCKTFTPDCEGLTSPLPAAAGWNTYDISIGPGATIYGIRFLFPENIQHKFDWVRVHAPGNSVNLTIPLASTETWWYAQTGGACTSSTPAVYPTPDATSGRIVGALGAGGVATFPAAQYPPGAYCIRYRNGGQWSDPTGVTVQARPQPVVIDPNVGGGDDYATVVRGDAWDFVQPSDVFATANANVNVSGGYAHGQNCCANPGDQQVILPQAGNIDANLYHRLTYKVVYDGTFGMGDGPGGGMVARLVWNTTSQPQPNETNDMVAYPGLNTVQVDLKTNPAWLITDEGTQSPVGWGGPASQFVNGLRFDPNEDLGARTWHIDDIRLARNARGNPNYPVTFKDNAWLPGTTADLYADLGQPGGTRYLIAQGVPMTAGVNNFNWNGTTSGGVAVPAPNTFWILAAVHHPAVAGANDANAYASGPLEMPAQPVYPPGAPTGAAAVGGLESANVSWVAPAVNGGAPVTGYVVTVQPGNTQAVVGNTTSTTIQGLNGGTPYTFTVAAQNSAGIGASSAASNSVVPSARPGTRFHAVVPYRALDSRGATGGWNGNALGPDQLRDLTVAPSGGAPGVPASATAVVMNVTVTGATAGSYLVAFPSGAGKPLAANLNFLPGETIPNLVTAKVGNNGAVRFYNAVGSVHIIADIVGYYDDGSGAGDAFVGVTPVRALDSQTATGGWNNTRLGQGAIRNLHLAGGAGVLPATATAVVMNVTVTGGTNVSYLQAYPAGALQPVTANVVFGTNQTVPNLVTVGIGTGGDVTFFNQFGTVHVIADVMGYYDAGAAGGRFHSVSPTRILDSRGNNGGWNSTKIGGPVTRSLVVAGANSIPPLATGVVMNTTVTAGSQASYLSVSPSRGAAVPGTANLLFGVNQTVPNLVVGQLPAGGTVDIFNQLGTVHVIADVSGYFFDT